MLCWDGIPFMSIGRLGAWQNQLDQGRARKSAATLGLDRGLWQAVAFFLGPLDGDGSTVNLKLKVGIASRHRSVCRAMAQDPPCHVTVSSTIILPSYKYFACFHLFSLPSYIAPPANNNSFSLSKVFSSTYGYWY